MCVRFAVLQSICNASLLVVIARTRVNRCVSFRFSEMVSLLPTGAFLHGLLTTHRSHQNSGTGFSSQLQRNVSFLMTSSIAPFEVSTSPLPNRFAHHPRFLLEVLPLLALLRRFVKLLLRSCLRTRCLNTEVNQTPRSSLLLRSTPGAS